MSTKTKQQYELSIKPTAGKLLTTYEGEAYKALGYTQLVLSVGEVVKDVPKWSDIYDCRFVTTVALNADGTPGQREFSMWVTDSGSVKPCRRADGGFAYRRMPRYQLNHYLSKIGA